MVASGELIASYDSGEMVRQARILAQSTAELIQAIKGEAETQSDSDLQVRFPFFKKRKGSKIFGVLLARIFEKYKYNSCNYNFFFSKLTLDFTKEYMI